MEKAQLEFCWNGKDEANISKLPEQNYDIYVRYSGGSKRRKFDSDGEEIPLNWLPSGILQKNSVNVLGPEMVINLRQLSMEMVALVEKGVRIPPDRLKISDRAAICMPYHISQEILENQRLGKEEADPASQGAKAAYADRYLNQYMCIGDLLDPVLLERKLTNILEWKNRMFGALYGDEKIEKRAMLNWALDHGAGMKEFVCDTSAYLDRAVKEGKKILFEDLHCPVGWLATGLQGK